MLILTSYLEMEPRQLMSRFTPPLIGEYEALKVS